MSFLVANLPPVKVYVKKEYLYDHEKGHGEFVEGVWITVKSIQGRALYFETYLPQYGALYDKLPISAFVNSPVESSLPLEELQLWDAFSYHAKTLQPDFKVSTQYYSVENKSKWTAGDDTNYFYDLKEQE